MATRRPLTQLAPTAAPVVHVEVEHKDASDRQKTSSSIGANLLLWFVIIGLIAWFLLYALKPKIVQKVGLDGQPTGEADVGKSLLGALLIALVVVLIIWLLRASK
jgi:hypothetical protein